MYPKFARFVPTFDVDAFDVDVRKDTAQDDVDGALWLMGQGLRQTVRLPCTQDHCSVTGLSYDAGHSSSVMLQGFDFVTLYG